MKVQDIVIKRKKSIDKDNEFIPIYFTRLRDYDLRNCYVITFKVEGYNRIIKAFAYRGKLPPFDQWYQYKKLPIFVRVISYFYSHKDEIFTSRELCNILKDVGSSTLRSAMSDYFKNYISVGKTKYYGHKLGLTNLENYLTKKKIQYERVTNEDQKLVITIRNGSKETYLTYTY